jgi:hypothetical protein
MVVLPFRVSKVRKTACGLLAAAALGVSGCNDSGGSKISSGLFLAPVSRSQPPGTIQVLAENLAFLSAIRPDATPEDLANLKADAFVLGRLSMHDQATGEVTRLDAYLIYESKTRALLSATLCGTEPAEDCSTVTLHYNGRGFDEAQLAPQGSAVSSKVPSLMLQNGWILSFDSGNRSIIAFRMDKERVAHVGGVPTDVVYRSFGPTSSANFGRGNGLLLSTVASAEELLQDLGTFGVLRFLEVLPGKVLVFFSTGAVHLLELTEVETLLPFDLNLGNPDSFECDPEEVQLCLPVTLLDGQFKLFPEGAGMGPLITAADIRAVTGGDSANLGTFTPACLTSCGGDSADCGLFLAFDQPSSSFLTLEVLTAGDDVTGAVLELAGIILDATSPTPDAPNTIRLPRSPPYQISGGFCRASVPTSVLLFEEASDNMLAYDPSKPTGDKNLSIYVDADGILERRDPTNTGSTNPSQGNTELSFAVVDVRDNRLAFNKGSREMLSFSYTTPVVVLSLSPAELSAATGSGGNFNYIELQEETDNDLRVFNNQANTLLSIKLQYETLPVAIKN